MARIFDSYIEGFAVRPSAGTYVTVEPVSSLAISGAFDGDAARNAQAAFESFMQANGVPPAAGEPAACSHTAGRCRRRPRTASSAATAACSISSCSAGRAARAENPRMPPLEAALFESGKPVLIVPRQAPASIGKNVLVAWNRSTEQANTNAYALPLLRLAEQVTVLTVEGGSVQRAVGRGRRAPSAPERRQGQGGDRRSAAARATGEVILERAAALGCDLLVKCAYTQSRLRQMIFGGATRHILGHATLPVFMAH